MSDPHHHDQDHDQDLGEGLARWADQASEAVRAINHATIAGPPLPAPVVYNVLGSLTRLGHGLDQAARQLGDRLAASATVFEVYEDDGADPHGRIAAACAALIEAADHAHRLGTALDTAQSAIARQGYRP